MPFLPPTDPSLEDYWRSIILFGRNVASYKFALAKSLLELNPQSGQLIKLEDLAVPFSRHVVEHLKVAKQGQMASSRYLDVCKSFSDGATSHDKLIAQTVRYGFVNVIDAFHVVEEHPIAKRFFIDERQQNAGIRITDEFSRLAESNQMADLPQEVESRWRLVETAWSLGIARGLLAVSHDAASDTLFVLDAERRRRNMTSSRGALNGYQKGYCFYCFRPIHLTEMETLPDVDHFFPHTLMQAGLQNLDGVWNLVLACRGCNRGVRGKSARVPTVRLLERLFKRNEFLIQSHHPLRETLRSQTGLEQAARRSFLNDFHYLATRSLPIPQWETEEVSAEVF